MKVRPTILVPAACLTVGILLGIGVGYAAPKNTTTVAAIPSPTPSVDAWESKDLGKVPAQLTTFRNNELGIKFQYPDSLGEGSVTLLDSRDSQGTATGSVQGIRFAHSKEFIGEAASKDFGAPIDGADVEIMFSDVQQKNGTCTYSFGDSASNKDTGPCEQETNSNGVTYFMGTEKSYDNDVLVLAIKTNNQKYPWVAFRSPRTDSAAQSVLKGIATSFQNF